MDISLSRCFVQVTDPEQALAFYRDALGLDVRKDVANDGFRWITVGAPSQPAVEIVLLQLGGAGDPAAGWQAGTATPAATTRLADRLRRWPPATATSATGSSAPG